MRLKTRAQALVHYNLMFPVVENTICVSNQALLSCIVLKCCVVISSFVALLLQVTKYHCYFFPQYLNCTFQRFVEFMICYLIITRRLTARDGGALWCFGTLNWRCISAIIEDEAVTELTQWEESHHSNSLNFQCCSLLMTNDTA